jgi:hypothetical protein
MDDAHAAIAFYGHHLRIILAAARQTPSMRPRGELEGMQVWLVR